MRVTRHVSLVLGLTWDSAPRPALHPHLHSGWAHVDPGEYVLDSLPLSQVC